MHCLVTEDISLFWPSWLNCEHPICPISLSYRDIRPLFFDDYASGTNIEAIILGSKLKNVYYELFPLLLMFCVSFSSIVSYIILFEAINRVNSEQER